MRRSLLSCVAGLVLLSAACGGDSGGSTDASPVTSPASSTTDTQASVDTGPIDTAPTTTSDATTTTMVPAIDGGYELAMVEAQRPYITLEGGTCDLAAPWSARLEPVTGGLSGTLEYSPSGDGMAGSVTVTFTAAGGVFSMTGTTSYTITPLDTAAAVPTTDETGSTTTLPDLGDLPDGALQISYGSIDFTANQPGAMIPPLPGEVWGPRLLVPAARDC